MREKPMFQLSLPCMRMCEQEICDRGWCPYIYIYVYDPPKSLNGTIVVDLPFQTLAVDFSLNL